MTFKLKTQNLTFTSSLLSDALCVMYRMFSSQFARQASLITIFAFVIFGSLLTANAQRRDNLTDQEDMLVRDAQEIDERMKVFVKVIDRRLMALTDAGAAQSKQAQKDSEKWGELRTGALNELFFDIQKTLSEAINKIDDVADREQKNPLFPKAVNILAEGCQRFTPQFKTLAQKVTDAKEIVLIDQSIDNCNLIIEASAKVPKEEKKKKN